jgi:hypothetical protein
MYIIMYGTTLNLTLLTAPSGPAIVGTTESQIFGGTADNGAPVCGLNTMRNGTAEFPIQIQQRFTCRVSLQKKAERTMSYANGRATPV